LNNFGVDKVEDIDLIDEDLCNEMKLRPLDKKKILNAISSQKDKNNTGPQTGGTPKGIQGGMTANISTQGPSNMFVFRQTLSPGHSILKMSVILSGPKPVLPLLQDLEKLLQLPSMIKLNLILEECLEWYEGWKWDDDLNPYGLTQDEALAIVLYTHDLYKNGTKEQNFYYQLNEMLRRRNNEEMNVWSGYLYFILSALKKFPDVTTTVFRGIPANCKEGIQKNYKQNRPIHWSGFSSATKEEEIAKTFAGPNGILFRIQVFNGKEINQCSFVPNEKEILLSPNMKFKVTNSLHLEVDGFFYLDIEEEQNVFDF